MLYRLIALSCVLFVVLGGNKNGGSNRKSKGKSKSKGKGKGDCGPVTSCYDQAPCLNFTTEEEEGEENLYKICLVFDSELDGCDANAEIQDACCNRDHGDNNGEVLESGNEICDIVACGESTSFRLKDGSASCKTDQTVIGEYEGLYGDAYCYDSSDCGRKDKACAWQVYAPPCPVDTPAPVTPAPTTSEPTVQQGNPTQSPVTPQPTTGQPSMAPTTPCTEECATDYHILGLPCDERCCLLTINDLEESIECIYIGGNPDGSNVFSRQTDDDAFSFAAPDAVLEEDEANTEAYYESLNAEDNQAAFVTKIGIAIGVVALLLIGGIVAFCMYRRKKQQNAVDFNHDSVALDATAVEGPNSTYTVN